MKNEIITDVINKNINGHIGTAARCIPEGLQRHKSFEIRIQKINKLKYKFFQLEIL